MVGGFITHIVDSFLVYFPRYLVGDRLFLSLEYAQFRVSEYSIADELETAGLVVREEALHMQVLGQ